MTQKATRAMLMFEEVLDAEGKPTGIKVVDHYEPPFPEGTDESKIPVTHKLTKRAVILLLTELSTSFPGTLLTLNRDFQVKDGRLTRTLPDGRKQMLDLEPTDEAKAPRKIKPNQMAVANFVTMPTIIWATELAAMVEAAQRRGWHDLADAVEAAIDILWKHSENKGPESNDRS